MKVVILSPHPDDAVLSCWGVLANIDQVTVVTVFAGQPAPDWPVGPWDALTGAHDPLSRWHERMDEDRRALGLAGLEPVRLPFLDGDYRSEGANRRELREAFERQQPTVLYAPAALLRHPDHLAVRDAALGLRDSGVEVRLYADQPHANVFGWPGWVTAADEERFLRVEKHWETILREAGIELSRLRPTVRRLDGEWPGKRAAIAAYRTQAPVLSRLSGGEDLRYELEWSWR